MLIYGANHLESSLHGLDISSKKHHLRLLRFISDSLAASVLIPFALAVQKVE